MDNFEEKYLHNNTNEQNQQDIKTNKNSENNLYFTLKNDELNNEFTQPKKPSNKFLIPVPKLSNTEVLENSNLDFC